MEKLIQVRSHVEKWWFEQMHKVDCKDMMHQSNFCKSEFGFTYTFSISIHPKETGCNLLVSASSGFGPKQDIVKAINAKLESLTPYLKRRQSLDPLPEMEVQDESA